MEKEYEAVAELAKEEEVELKYVTVFYIVHSLYSRDAFVFIVSFSVSILLSPPNNSQNISSPPEQSSPQIHSAPPPLEQPPSLNIPQPNGEQILTHPGHIEQHPRKSLMRTSSQCSKLWSYLSCFRQ